jgi:hypothetical protein
VRRRHLRSANKLRAAEAIQPAETPDLDKLDHREPELDHTPAGAHDKDDDHAQ